MLFGNKEEFAIQIEIDCLVDHWVYGRFLMWVRGKLIGDQSEYSVDIKGCLNWLTDLVKNPRDRFEPGLYEMPKEQAFLRLASSVLAHEDKHGFVEETYRNTFSRFHISHIGMSSFDNLVLLLIKNKDGAERLIWKVKDGEVMEALLQKNIIEEVSFTAVEKVSEEIKCQEKEQF